MGNVLSFGEQQVHISKGRLIATSGAGEQWILDVPTNDSSVIGSMLPASIGHYFSSDHPLVYNPELWALSSTEEKMLACTMVADPTMHFISFSMGSTLGKYHRELYEGVLPYRPYLLTPHLLSLGFQDGYTVLLDLNALRGDLPPWGIQLIPTRAIQLDHTCETWIAAHTPQYTVVATPYYMISFNYGHPGA